METVISSYYVFQDVFKVVGLVLSIALLIMTCKTRSRASIWLASLIVGIFVLQILPTVYMLIITLQHS